MRIFNVKWTSLSAGPSQDNNRRTEVFLAGCRMAMKGSPCRGCFNPAIWNPNHCVADVTPVDAAGNIIIHAPNRYVTFVGGEPLDQIHELSETCRILKNQGYHICVITHYELNEIIGGIIVPHDDCMRLLENMDILIDGRYDENLRIWDEEKAGDGLHDVVGSGNQVIWDVREWNRNRSKAIEGYQAGKLAGIALNRNDDLVYVTMSNDISDGMETMTIGKRIAA